jgi:hypothetical protein
MSIMDYKMPLIMCLFNCSPRIKKSLDISSSKGEADWSIKLYKISESKNVLVVVCRHTAHIHFQNEIVKESKRLDTWDMMHIMTKVYMISLSNIQY